MTAEHTPSGSFLTPYTKAIRDIGLPAAIIIFLLGVLTGIIPTPIMKALDVILDVHADQEGVTSIMQQQLQVSTATCEFLAPDKDAVKKCYPTP